MRKIILATTSPYRREAFGFLNIPFEGEGSNVDESQLERGDPEELVKSLAKMKAEAVAKNHNDAIIIGFDSVGLFNGEILEKPKSKEDAFERLKNLSGNNFQFFTGVHIINTQNNKTLTEISKTNAVMRELSGEEISKYLDEDSRFNTYALGFDPFGHSSSAFVERIEGSYNNLLRGIPLELIVKMLKEIER